MKGHLFIVALALAACGPYGATTVVENRSSNRLEHIVISVDGREYQVGTLDRGESRTIVVYPEGEAGVGVAYTAGQRSIRVPEEGYVENGYHLAVVLDGTGATISSKVH